MVIEVEMSVVAIFAALEEEREILAGMLHLSGSSGGRVLSGQRGATSIYLYGPCQIGRVPAAIETLKFFQEHGKPDLLVVAGIAGGIQAAGVALGDVIVATTIADIATRKIQEDHGKIVQDFRPKAYGADARVKNYLCSPEFDKDCWQSEVAEAAGWPTGNRPQILYGTLASSDAVVASQEWVSGVAGHILELWPDLLGVEMEAGGVCAVAEEFGVQISVVRCVADYANPAKSDDEWRQRAITTLGHLLQSLDFEALVEVLNPEAGG